MRPNTHVYTCTHARIHALTQTDTNIALCTLMHMIEHIQTHTYTHTHTHNILYTHTQNVALLNTHTHIHAIYIIIDMYINSV